MAENVGNAVADAASHMAGNIADMASNHFDDIKSWGWLAEITDEERQKISFYLEDGEIENTTDPAVMQAILDLLDLGTESRPEPSLPAYEGGEAWTNDYDDIISSYTDYGDGKASGSLNF